MKFVHLFLTFSLELILLLNNKNIMFKHILAGAGDINWMAIFALLTFVWLFVVSAITIFRKSNSFIDHMARLPLDEENDLK